MLHKHMHKHKKNEQYMFVLLVLMLMLCYVAVFTSENSDDISTSTTQSTIPSAILLNIEGSWYREFRQEMVFCACVFPYAYVASVLTCLSLCLCLCLCFSENQPLYLAIRSEMNLSVIENPTFISLYCLSGIDFP